MKDHDQKEAYEALTLRMNELHLQELDVQAEAAAKQIALAMDILRLQQQQTEMLLRAYHYPIKFMGRLEDHLDVCGQEVNIARKGMIDNAAFDALPKQRDLGRMVEKMRQVLEPIISLPFTSKPKDCLVLSDQLELTDNPIARKYLVEVGALPEKVEPSPFSVNPAMTYEHLKNRDHPIVVLDRAIYNFYS